MSAFIVSEGAVWMVGKHKPARLSEPLVERLLDVFDEADAPEQFNELFDAYVRTGGVPRCSSFREII